MQVGGDGQQPSYPPRTLAHIDVDIAGLDDFRVAVSHELDSTLKPVAHGIILDHGRGVGFGWHNAGGQVQAARQRYHESLETAAANLTSYIQASNILIEAMHRIGAAYRDTDAAATSRATDVGVELDAAIAAVRQAQSAESAAALQRDWQHRIARTPPGLG
jgi:hypothetical protein